MTAAEYATSGTFGLVDHAILADSATSAVSVSGDIPASQVTGLPAPVTTLPYSSITDAPAPVTSLPYSSITGTPALGPLADATVDGTSIIDTDGVISAVTDLTDNTTETGLGTTLIRDFSGVLFCLNNGENISLDPSTHEGAVTINAIVEIIDTSVGQTWVRPRVRPL